MPLFKGGAWTNPVPPTAHGPFGGASKVAPSLPSTRPVQALRGPRAEEAIDFFANLSAWNGGGLPSIVNGDTLDFGMPTTTYSNHQVFSNASYYWRDSGIFFQVPQIAQGTGTGTVQTYFGVQVDASNSAQWDIRESSGVFTIYAKHTIATVETTVASATYDPAAHLWLRLRESQGSLIWECSPNGRVWNAFTSETSPFDFVGQCSIYGGSGYFGTLTPTQSGQIRMLNVPPNLLRWQEATFEGGVEHWDLSSSGGVASIAADTSQARVGSSSMLVTVSGGADAYVSSVGTHTGLLGAPVAPNTEYTMVYSMLHDTAMHAVSTAIWVQLVWFDVNGASIGSVNNNWVNPYAAVGTSWVDSSFYVGISPPNAAYAQLIFAHGGNVSLPANGKWWIDRVGVIQGNRAPSFWTAPTAPTGPYVSKVFNSYYNGGGTGETTTGSYPIYAGDLLVMTVVDQSGSAHLNYTPSNSGTNLSWTRRVDEYVASSCPIQIWTAYATATQAPQTFTIASTGTQSFTWNVLRVTGHGESTFGGNTSASTSTDTTQPYLISATTQATNSTVITVWGDWNGNDGSTRTLVPTTSTELDYQFQSTHLTAGVEWTTVASASTLSTGVTGFGTTSPVLTLGTIEIRKLSSNAYTQAVSGGLSYVGSIPKSVGRPVSAGQSFVGSNVKLSQKKLAPVPALGFTGATNKSLARSLAGALSYVGSISKRTARALAAALSFIGSIAFTKQFIRALTGALSYTGSSARKVARSVSGALSFTGAVATSKSFFRSLTGALSYTGSLSAGKFLARALTGGLSFVGSQRRQVAKNLTGAGSFTGVLPKASARGFAGVLNPATPGTLLTPTVRGSSLKTATDGTITVAQGDFSVAPQAGDLLVALCSIESSGMGSPGFPTPSGWTLSNATGWFVDPDIGPAGEMYVFTKAWSSSDTTYSFAPSLSPFHWGIIVDVLCIAGANTTSPLDGTPTNTASLVGSSVTTANSNSLLIAHASSLFSLVKPGSMTDWGNAFATDGTGSGIIQAVAVEALSSSGSTGSRTFTGGGGEDNVSLFAIKGLVYDGALNKLTSRKFSGVGSFAGTFSKRGVRAISGALSFVGSQTRRSSKAVTAALSFTGTQAKRTARAFAGALSFTGTFTKFVSRALSGVLSFAGTIGTVLNGGAHAYTSSLSATLSFTGTQAKSITRGLSAALSFVGAFVKARFIVLAGALSFTGSASKQDRKSLSGALGFTGSAAKSAGKALTGALSYAGSISRSVAKSLAGSLSFTGSITRALTRSVGAALSFVGAQSKRTARSLAGGLGYTGSLVKSLARNISGALSLTGATAAGKAFIRAFSGALSFTGSQVKQAGKAATAALSFAGSQSKRVGRALSGALSFVGNLSSVLNGGGTAYTKTLTASLSYTGSVARTVVRSLAGAMSFTGSMFKSRLAALAGALSFTGSARKQTARSLSGALGFTGGVALKQTLFRALSASLGFAGATVKKTSRSLSGALGFTGSVFKTRAVNFAAAISFVGSITKRTFAPLSGGLSYIGTLNRSFPIRFTAAVSFVGATAKQTRRLLAGTLTSIGALAAGRLFARAFSAAVGFTGSISRRTGKALGAALGFVPGFSYIAHILNPAPEITHPDVVVTSLSGDAVVTTVVGSMDGADYAGSLVLASTGTSVLVTSGSGDIQ